MSSTPEFLKMVLDTVEAHIVVLDQEGSIRFCNRSWSRFGEQNACRISDEWSGVNYLHECDRAAAAGDDFGARAGAGIRGVMAGHRSGFYLEYPCHSARTPRWFMMRVTPFEMDGRSYFVISHQDITERKASEDEVLRLAYTDALTGIHNKRFFDEFFGEEWRRCVRAQSPLALVVIDIDHFKVINDTHGHMAGDRVLVGVARILADVAHRPGDLCARVGGDEFMLVLGNTSQAQARIMGDRIAVRMAEISLLDSAPAGSVTVSIGLASLCPSLESRPSDLVRLADAALYRAKGRGRNRIEA